MLAMSLVPLTFSCDNPRTWTWTRHWLPFTRPFKVRPLYPSPSLPCAPSLQKPIEKNTLIDRTLAAVAERETKLAETWAQCEAKLREKQAKYEEKVAAQQAGFDASVQRMTEELNRAVAQQEETVRALAEGLADERAAHEHTRLALAEEKARVEEAKKREVELSGELDEAKKQATAEAEQLEAARAKITKLQEEIRVVDSAFKAVKFTKDHLSGKLAEANAELESTASRLATYSAARHASSVEIGKLQREKEETEAKLRRTEMARAALQLSSDAACALAAQRANEVGQLTRERDNLVAKNTTLRDNATEDAQRLAQLHERIGVLEAREQTLSPKSFFAAPRHPIAVANSAAKGRSRRSLSAGPSPATLDLTADSGEEDDENSQPSTRKHRSGKRTGAAGTPKK